MELHDRTAIVTGSGRGIGRALAIELSRHGANVLCCARNKTHIEETVALITNAGGSAISVPTDVTDWPQVCAMTQLAIDRFGQIDVLFNNAGSFDVIGGLWEIDPDAWWHDVTVNLRGPMLCCRAVLPHMIKRDEGIILNMNGGGAESPLPGGSAYGSSKAALLRLTDTLAAELEIVGSRVLVFAIGPGLVRTTMTQLQADSKAGRKWIPSTRRSLKNGNHHPPEDCAQATIELLRIACSELNGRIFDVGTDFNAIAQDTAAIKQNDRHTLRSRY